MSARAAAGEAKSGRTLRARAHAGLARLVGQPLFWVAFVAVIASWPISLSLRAAADLPPPLPILGTVPSFQLEDQFGKPFGSADLDGKVWAASFFFTRCPTVCPRLMETTRKVQRRSRNLGEAFQVVSFSVDPAHDSPDVLKAYADRWQVRHQFWSLLTGSAEEVKRTVVGGLRIAMDDVADGADPAGVLHGTHFVLVDGHGRIRGYYDSTEPAAVDLLLDHAGRLANTGE